MSRKLILIAVTILGAALCIDSAYASEPGLFNRKKKAKTEQKDTTKKLSPYVELFKKEQKKAQGMITLHLKEGKVYFELPLALLGREMVMGSTIKSISDNANGVVGVKPSEMKDFVFTKADSTIQMRTVNSSYISGDPNICSALSKSTIGAVEKAFPIKAYSPDSSAVVFDMTDIFLNDDKSMSPFSEYAQNASYKREDNYKKDLSYITDVKAFEDNVSVTSSMTYTYTLTDGNGKEMVKDEPLTAELTRSVIMLPEKIYHPRMDDYRIGVFWTERMKLADGSSSSEPVYLANRWRLEPSDTAAYRRGELVAPKKPIVFYVDNDFPEWWKPYISEAISQWSEMFAKIGFKDAVVARPFPTPEEDPEFDPENIKYNCVRYAPIGIQNAMGPSWTDPRSGEIINASVYVYHDVIKLLTQWMFVQIGAADSSVRHATLPREVLGDGLRYVLSHEVGHCLGFMHNMSGSSVIPVDSLRSPSFTKENGTTTSIMDYARFNYVAQPGDKERGVKLTPPRFGKYDEWLVRWAYTPVFDVDDFAKEAEITSGWITDSLKKAPYYRYGKQQMSSMLFDPRCQNEDLGDDVVKATEYGIANLKYILPKYYGWIPDADDMDMKFRTDVYNTILNQYLTYAQQVALNIGGLYTNEVKAGDTTSRFANVPRKKQKECLDCLFKMESDVDWLAPKELAGKLPIVGTPEYKVAQTIQGLILMTPFWASYSDGVTTKEYSFRECMDDIYARIWKPTASGSRLDRFGRSFQREFVDQLLTAGNFKQMGTDARSITDANPVSGYEWTPRFIFNHGDVAVSDVYAYLSKARDLMKLHRAAASTEDRAHYDLLIAKIDYAFDN
jgi:hypothetical protein